MSSTLVPAALRTPCEATIPGTAKLDARVVLLTHYIPLYQVRLFQTIAQNVRELKILLSTPLEPNRHFEPDWGGLDVTVQKSLTLQRNWHHRAGFTDPLYVHFPYDTYSQLRRIQPDIILSLELGFRSTVSALYRKLHPRSRLVIATYMSEHTEQGRGLLRRLIRGWLIRTADVLTYNGPSCERYLRSIGAKPSKLLPLPYVADDRTLYHGPLERTVTQRHRLLYVGQLSERKGVLPCLEQLSEYARMHPEQRLELDLIGTGPLQNQIQSFVPPNNFVVRYLGSMSAEKLGHQMSQYGALLLPTLADEWAMVVNEALHAGLPIIGSNLAQAVETLVTPHVANDAKRIGWAYDPRTTTGLAECLDRFFATSDIELEAMRLRCRESVRELTPAYAGNAAIQALQAACGR